MSVLLKFLFSWLPRCIAILFIALLSLTSLDVFGMGAGIGETLVAFLVHNIPAFVLLLFLLIGWRWAWVGGVGFIVFGVWYLIFAFGVDREVRLLLGVTPIVTGVLFLVGWLFRRRIRSG